MMMRTVLQDGQASMIERARQTRNTKLAWLVSCAQSFHWLVCRIGLCTSPIHIRRIEFAPEFMNLTGDLQCSWVSAALSDSALIASGKGSSVARGPFVRAHTSSDPSSAPVIENMSILVPAARPNHRRERAIVKPHISKDLYHFPSSHSWITRI